MSDVQTNIMRMKVNDMVDLLVPMMANSEPRDLPPVMFWGPPGIGKSQGIKEVANQLENKTGKNVNFRDVRLLLFNPVDLRGIPVANAERTLAKWLKPEIFQMDESEDVINILMLEEISAAPPSVQAAAYQMTLDRVIGEHKIPDNCFILAAGNRVTDKSVAYKMPKALSNRLCHIEIHPDVDDWKKWAIPTGIDQRIIGYINFKQAGALFNFDGSSDDNAYPTPRSWEMVDKYLKRINSIEKAFPFIAGSIGLGAANEFKAWARVFDKLPDIKAIYDGKETKVPESPDVLYALSAALVANAHNKSKKQLSNLIKYTNNMQAEFATLTVKDIIRLKDVKTKLLAIDEWIEWSRKFKNLII